MNISHTLIIPDIHEQITALRSDIVPLIEQATHVVFLGDWFDTFSKDKCAIEMCRFIQEHTGEKYTKLLGNHDCHYFFNHHWFMCSGFKPHTMMVVKNVLTPEDIEQFKIYTQIGKFVLSHAGFHPETIKYFHPTVEKEALDLARRGEFHPVFHAGLARGGQANFGGPTWLDWNYEFLPMGTPQIVGHTHVDGSVRVKDDNGVVSYCLDSGLKHVMWTDGQDVEIVSFEAIKMGSGL